MNGHITIGVLSARTGVRVKALREYTDLGLIHTLGRSAAGYRLYTDDALWCVRFIGELRGLGLTIALARHATLQTRESDALFGWAVVATVCSDYTRLRAELRQQPIPEWVL